MLIAADVGRGHAGIAIDIGGNERRPSRVTLADGRGAVDEMEIESSSRPERGIRAAGANISYGSGV